MLLQVYALFLGNGPIYGLILDSQRSSSVPQSELSCWLLFFAAMNTILGLVVAQFMLLPSQW
jgi:hypothetical protein